jgi:hypothetical protein
VSEQVSEAVERAYGERPYVWPPFAEGNTLGLTHGALVSAQRLSKEERTHELAQTILATQPTWHEADRLLVERLAIVYVRIERATAAIEHTEALAMSTDAPTASFRIEWMAGLRGDLARWMRLASELEDRLGRSPASRAKMSLHVASAQREATRADLLARYGSENGQDTIDGEATDAES